MFGITTMDQEIADVIYKEAEKYNGHYVRKSDNNGTRCPTYYIANNYKGNILLSNFQKFGSEIQNNIPRIFLCSSREDRLKLLAGIIDTDGYSRIREAEYGPHVSGIEIVQKRLGYIEDIEFLARSLGFRATRIRNKYVNGACYYRTSIYGDFPQIPVILNRKKLPARKQIKKVNRTGFTIKHIGYGDYYGFTLDGDGRFLLGDFTVTHNTVTSGVMSQKLPSERIVFHVHRDELVRQTINKWSAIMPDEEFGVVKAERDELDKKILVVSAQTLARKKRLERVSSELSGSKVLFFSDERSS